jgi:hypothetical protein
MAAMARAGSVETGAPAAPVSIAVRSNDHLDAVKLAAIGLMAANHLMLALPQPWPDIGHLLGRPCLALFAFILATRLANAWTPGVAKTTRRLLIWGVVALPPYLLLVGGVALRLDVLFTLAAGAGGFWLWRDRRWLALGLLALALAGLNPWLDGGALGAAAVTVAAIFAHHGRPARAAVAAALLVALSNLIASSAQPLAAAAVLAALPILGLLRPLGRLTPRLPGWLFYAFYPVHLLAIWLVLGPYG